MQDDFGIKVTLNYVIPFNPEPIRPIASGNTVVGERIVYYFNRANVRITQDIKDDLQLLDSCRNQCITSQIFSNEVGDRFFDYVSLLESLTHGIDITGTGADVIFSWAGMNRSEIAFDILCLGTTLIARGFNTISKGSFITQDDMKSNLQLLGYIKRILNTISPYNSPEYQSVIIPEVFSKIDDVIMATHFYVLICFYIMKADYEMSSQCAYSLYKKLLYFPNYEKSDFVFYWKVLAWSLMITYTSKSHFLSKTLGGLQSLQSLKESYAKRKKRKRNEGTY